MQLPQDWTPPDVAATLISLSSLLVAAKALHLSNQARHPDVRVSGEIVPDEDFGPRLQIQVHNRSLRNIYLEDVHLAVGRVVVPDSLWKWKAVTWPYTTLLTYPYTLEPGRKVTELLNPKYVADFIGDMGHRKTAWLQCCYTDEMGNVYRGNQLKFEVSYWRAASPRVLKPDPIAEAAPSPANFTRMHLPEKSSSSEAESGASTVAIASTQRTGRTIYLYSESALQSALSVATGVVMQQYSPQREAGGLEGLQLILGDVEVRLRIVFDSGQSPTMEVISKAVSDALTAYRASNTA